MVDGVGVGVVVGGVVVGAAVVVLTVVGLGGGLWVVCRNNKQKRTLMLKMVRFLTF